MQSRLLGVAVVAVAVAATINALAFKTADVTNSFAFTIANTSSAILALDAPDSSAKDPGVSVSTGGGTGAGYLVVTVSEKIQPNSVYLFQQAFKIKNNSNDSNQSSSSYPVTISGYNVTGCTGVTLDLLQTGTNTPLTGASITAGASQGVDLRVTTPANTAAGPVNCTVTISASR